MKEWFKFFVVTILTWEARLVLHRHKPKIVAITGSVGKTSTKDAVFSAIKNHVYARKSEKSFNSDIGIPLTILALPNGWNNPFLWLRNIFDGLFTAVFARRYPEVLVLEVGLDKPGSMDKLVSWLKPDVVVLTRLPEVPAHIELFGSKEVVIEEKMKLASALNDDGVFIYNHDDMQIQAQLSEVRHRQVGYARYLQTDFTAREDKVVYRDDVPAGVEFTIFKNEDSYRLMIKDTVGVQQVYVCLAALAVADELSVPLAQSIESLSELRTPNGRMRIVQGIKGTIIIDDTYNSSPVACEQALQTLHEMKYAKRRIAVLGDMLELGKYSSAEHKRVGELVAKNVDVLFTVGVRARQFAEGALAGGMSERDIYQYDDADRAGRELQNFIQNGDVLLIKASQGIRAEKIVEEIMAEPEKATELLARQDETWKKI